jgi:quinol monooxygenase YgiN
MDGIEDFPGILKAINRDEVLDSLEDISTQTRKQEGCELTR